MISIALIVEICLILTITMYVMEMESNKKLKRENKKFKYQRNSSWRRTKILEKTLAKKDRHLQKALEKIRK